MHQTPSASNTAAAPRPLILFMDKIMLQPAPKQMRGVEIFNLALIRDCVQLGLPLIVAAHPSWRPLLGAGPDCFLAAMDNILWNGLTVVFSLRRRPFTVLLLGNVANRLIPALRAFQWLHPAARVVMFAHRDPARRFLKALSPHKTTVTAVNRVIADHFRQAGLTQIANYYGIPCADQFHPAADAGQRPDPVNFCLLGSLDASWKGADTAVAAYDQLPTAVRYHCRLHLAGYRQPPVFADTGIIAYPWMPAEAVPDFLRRMDVMIVASRDEHIMRETFSQAIVQGMLTGLPILVNNLPILAEKLDAGGGFVFHDTAELARYMLQLAGDPGLRRKLGREARQTALARYVWQTAEFAKRHLCPSAVV